MTAAKPFIPLLMVVGGVILLQQAVDLALLLPGVDFATPAGRVRQLLAVESRSPGLLAADLLLLWGSILGGKRQVLLGAGALHLTVGALLLALLPLFLVDAGSLAHGFGSGEATAFKVVVARTLLVLAFLGLAGLLGGRALRTLTRDAKTASATP
jgi:hypothetical protein